MHFWNNNSVVFIVIKNECGKNRLILNKNVHLGYSGNKTADNQNLI